MGSKTIPETVASLENIARVWNVMGMSQKPHEQVIHMLFPDILDGTLVVSSQYIKFQKEDSDNNSIDSSSTEKNFASAYSSFMHGNLKRAYNQAGDSQFANSNVITKLLRAIEKDTPLEYQGSSILVGCRKNMLQKIYYLVSQTDKATLHNVLTLEIFPFDAKAHQGANLEERKEIEKVIRSLDKIGTTGALCYAIFLLILTSVFRDRTMQLEALYCDDTIKKVIRASMDNSFLPTGFDFFSDEKYMNTYNVYMYRSPVGQEGHLYNKGTLELDKGDIIPSAALSFEDIYKTDPISHSYKGNPIIANDVVYVIMSDEKCKGTTGILCFKYEEFQNTEPMYFRLALFISRAITGTLQVQRAIITTKELTSDNEDAIKGLLRTSGKQIFLTEDELERFVQNNRTKAWIQKFENVFNKQILAAKLTEYWIDESRILEYEKNDFTEEELVQIAYSLKNFSDSQWKGKDMHIDCTPPEHFHRLMR